jgi:hypothetical protein
MEIKTTKQIQKKHPCDETKWVAVDDCISMLNRVKSPFPDFNCECRNEQICAMCAVKKMIEGELNSLSNEKTEKGK